MQIQAASCELRVELTERSGRLSIVRQQPRRKGRASTLRGDRPQRPVSGEANHRSEGRPLFDSRGSRTKGAGVSNVASSGHLSKADQNFSMISTAALKSDNDVRLRRSASRKRIGKMLCIRGTGLVESRRDRPPIKQRIGCGPSDRNQSSHHPPPPSHWQIYRDSKADLSLSSCADSVACCHGTSQRRATG